jgi:hypothetical protein
VNDAFKVGCSATSGNDPYLGIRSKQCHKIALATAFEQMDSMTVFDQKGRAAAAFALDCFLLQGYKARSIRKAHRGNSRCSRRFGPAATQTQ